MKNVLILYRTDMELNSTGAARTTILLINYLSKHGYKCYCLFNIKDGPTDNVVYLPRPVDMNEELHQIVENNKIDVVLVPEGVRLASKVRTAIGFSDKYKLVSALHNKPGFERQRQWARLKENVMLNTNIIKRLGALVLMFFYPLFMLWRIMSFRRQFRKLYIDSDVLVLLSDSYIGEFSKLYHVGCEKLCAIGNPYSFDKFASNEDIDNKKKSILIVSRMSEDSKRISWALKIWEELYEKYPGWSLDIVGDGRSAILYKKHVKRHKLERVTFWGRQAPLDFYKQSSIFMMTSAYEGWPMTIGESMQMGCVPIAFDSFSSIYNLINDGNNGFIIREGDMDSYISKLETLMSNDGLRKTMAESAIKKSQEFAPDKVCQKYVDLFNKITG